MATIADPYSLRRDHPAIKQYGYLKTSERTPDYNCIAWAAGETHVPWWPINAPGCFWPAGTPCEENLEAFVAAFTTLGYAPCDDGTREENMEKVAIYAVANEVTHMARQLADGLWTSKLGSKIDIRHDVRALEDSAKYGRSIYGKVVRYMKRSRRTRG